MAERALCCRDKMQQDKHMMEQQLQEAGGADLERQLSSRNSSCSEVCLVPSVSGGLG